MPSTYTTNNGIEKIATGEQSGTWGDTTNVNFDLLDEALDGQVSVALTGTGTSGSPNDLEITDGTSSNGRNRFVEFTGTPGGDTYVRLTPNDAEKVLFIQNSTNQTLLLFQGTYDAARDYPLEAGRNAVVRFTGTGTTSYAYNALEDLKVSTLETDILSVSDDSTGEVLIESTAAPTLLRITSTNDGATEGPRLNLMRNSATPAADDNIAEIQFSGKDSGGNTHQYAKIEAFIEDPTAGSEGGRLNFNIITNGAGSSLLMLRSDTGGTDGEVVVNESGDVVNFRIEGSTAGNLFVTDAANDAVVVGHDTAFGIGGGTPPPLQVVGITGATSSMGILRNQSTSSGPSLRFARSRGSSKGDVTIVQDADQLGAINFYGADGTDYASIGAQIVARVDGTPGVDDMPGSLEFWTTADGANTGTQRMVINRQGRIGIGTDSPEDIIHVIASTSNDAKIQLENASSPRGNYIGMVDSDNIEIAADEDNVGTGSTIRFRVDASEKMRITDNGRILINKTTEHQPTNAPPVLVQSHDTTGSAMMVGRNDTTVGVGDNIGAYLFRTGDSSGVKYGGMISRGRNTTGDAYLGFYSVDSRLSAGSEPDHVMLETMDLYSRAGSHYVGYNVTGGTYATAEDGFFAYNDGDGTNRSTMLIRTRDGTGSDYVYRHTRRTTIKSEIEEDGSFHSAPNSYGGTSDERLKENIVASGSQWDDIKAVQVKKYSWIEEGLDAPNQLGVIAQDLMASGMNGLVQQHFKTNMNPETKEDEPILDADGNQEEFYTVKYSVLYMKAIKALQEAMERIETLETKVAALEAE